MRVETFIKSELGPSFVDQLLQALQFDVSQILSIHRTVHSPLLSPYFQREILLLQSILLCLVRFLPVIAFFFDKI